MEGCSASGIRLPYHYRPCYIVSLLVSGKITLSIARVKDILNRIAQGELRIDTKALEEVSPGKDEVAVLARSLLTMLSNLRKIVIKILDASSLAALSEEVSAATEEQNASLEEVNSTVQALTQTAQKLQKLVERFTV